MCRLILSVKLGSGSKASVKLHVRATMRSAQQGQDLQRLDALRFKLHLLVIILHWPSGYQLLHVLTIERHALAVTRSFKLGQGLPDNSHTFRQTACSCYHTVRQTGLRFTNCARSRYLHYESVFPHFHDPPFRRSRHGPEAPSSP